MAQKRPRPPGPEKDLKMENVKLDKIRARTLHPYLTLAQFREIEAALLASGYGGMITWSETVKPPRDCNTFAKEAIYVICNSGIRVTIGNRIYWKCVRALRKGKSATDVFGHPGKAPAIDHIW